jgi:hypothetical protein
VQGIFDFVELERLDDGFNFLHRCNPSQEVRGRP